MLASIYVCFNIDHEHHSLLSIIITAKSITVNFVTVL